jgi:rubrerythrin
MPMLGQNLEAMKLLVEVEQATALLYRRFSECYPDHKQFWIDLAYEEDAHAIWVRNLVEKMQHNRLSFRDDRFAPETFRTFLGYLQGRIKETEENCPSLHAALAIAIDIEEAFVERGFLSIFDSDDTQVRTTLQRLSTESAAHLQRIQTYLRLLRMGEKRKA